MKFYNYNSSLINPQYETILKILSQSNVINDNYKLDVIINDSSEKYNAIYDESKSLYKFSFKISGADRKAEIFTNEENF